MGVRTWCFDRLVANSCSHAQRVLASVDCDTELRHDVAHGLTRVQQGGPLARQLGRPHPVTAALHVLEGGRERNVLFNDALNTFYLRLYGVRHIVKDLEGNVLFNDALNTFYLQLYGVRHIVKDLEGNFYLTTHSTYFIYGYMASDIWLRTWEECQNIV